MVERVVSLNGGFTPPSLMMAIFVCISSALACLKLRKPHWLNQ